MLSPLDKKVILTVFLSLSLAGACGAPTTVPATQIKTTNSTGSDTVTSPTGFNSPNMPAGATYPAIAAWTMYPLTLDPNPVYSGQPVTIWTNVYMVDFLITFIVARLEVNGNQVDQANWMLYIDEADPHFFVYTPPAPGMYNITIIADLEENEAYNQKGGEQISISQSATLVVN